MKTLIVFYSRTGCTRKVAEELAGKLGADMEELKETKDRSGAGGFLLAGRDAMLKRSSELLPTTRNAADYDLVIAATPIWAATMCPAIRTWLTREAANLRSVAFIATQGGSGAERAFTHMQEFAKREPLATLILLDRDIKTGAIADALTAFAEKLRK
jgi:menaquinone-dependent protoporphyrinogen IX oxidase